MASPPPVPPPHQLGDRSTPPAKEPRTAEYELRFDLYAGTEIPVGFKGEVMVEVCFGPARNTRQSDWVEMNEETSKCVRGPLAP